MPNERPVTGSCERCARGHDLLIPEPGSGDLDFPRIGARFSWCAGCARVVGRTCCWDSSAGLCADCAALRAVPQRSLSDAVLARNALSGLTAATESMDALEERLHRLPVTDESEARNGWEDAWLEAGVVIVRAESAAEIASARGAAASVTPANTHWLTDELATLGAAWEDRRRAAADGLERTGLRIRSLGALTLPAAAPAASPAERQMVAVPVNRTLSPVTHLPVRETALVGARPSAPPRPEPRAAAHPSATPRPPARARPGGRPVAPARPDAAVEQAPGPPAARRLARPPGLASVPPPPAEPVVLDDRHRSRRPVRPAEPPPRGRVARPVGAVPSRPPRPARGAPPRPVAAAARPTPAPAVRPSTMPRSGRAAVVLTVALLALIGAVVAALSIADRLGGAVEPSPRAVAPVASPQGSEAGGGAPSPSADATTTGAPSGETAAAVTFDAERIGPLAADAAGIARVLGLPEVAAFPTSFDRSLLLASPGSGACLVGVAGEPARSLAIDLRTGSRTQGTLRITPTDRPHEVVVLEPGAIGLEPETWYSVQVAWVNGTVNLEVRERDDGRAVHRGTLAPATGDAQPPGSGALCLEALGVSEATVMHIDNGRVGS